MKDFKGFNDWIEIFRGGKQKDSLGREQDGDALIEKAVASFNTADHEPPLVVGHPKDNAPAFGWVKNLASYGDNGVKVLRAQFRQVVPEFEDAVKSGLYKKRSASFYPDGRLRHVGFLGAAPPAVKGLADLKFDDQDDAVTFDFYDDDLDVIGRMFRRLRDFFIEKFGKDTADEIIPDWDVEYMREKARQPSNQDGTEAAFSSAENRTDDDIPAPEKKEGAMSFKEKLKSMLSFTGMDVDKIPDDAFPDAPPGSAAGASMFTEADIEAARKQAAADERKKADAEFAEKERKKAREAREKEITDWCEENVEKGRIAPAWVEYGLPQILSFLAANEDVVEFGETKEKASHYDRLKGLFENEIPKIVEFREIADRDGDLSSGSAGARLDAIVRQKLSQDKDLSFSEAFSLAQKENPALASEYQQEISG